VEADVLTRLALLFVIALVPLDALAQGSPPGPRWDVAATTGLFAGEQAPDPGGSGYQERWFHGVQGGVTVGRYLTRHLKLELEASTTTGGSLFRERAVSVPGAPYPLFVGSEVTMSVPSVGAALTWQFRDNEWVHPFIHAGVAAEFDRRTTRTWEHFIFTSPLPGVPPERVYEDRFEGPTVTTALRGVLGGGAKVYFNQRAFVRTDGRWSFDRTRQNIALRIGVGLDY
jgi:hypothetical protein